MRTHNHPSVTLLALAALIAGCGAPLIETAQTDSQSVPLPVGSKPNDVSRPSAACFFAPRVDSIELSEGSRAFLDFRSKKNGVVRLSSVPVGWSHEEIEPGRFVIKAPLGSVGTHRVSLEVTCGDATRSSEIDVTVRPLTWSRPYVWKEGVDGPSARRAPALWLDESNPDHLYVFGGQGTKAIISSDLWRLDLATGAWTELEQQGEIPRRVGGAVQSIPGERAVLYLGGRAADGSRPDVAERLDLESLTWTSLVISPARNQGGVWHALIHDAPRGRLVSACGGTSHGEGMQCDVQALSVEGAGVNRTPLHLEVEASGRAPRDRFVLAHVYDAETERLVIVNGSVIRRDYMDRDFSVQDAWALDLGGEPPVWHPLPEPPEGVGNVGCAALDPVGHRMFVWGGTAGNRSVVPGLHVLDLEPGRESWTTLDLPGAPEERIACRAVYDPKRHRILFGFGADGVGEFADLHVLEL